MERNFSLIELPALCYKEKLQKRPFSGGLGIMVPMRTVGVILKAINL